MIGGACARRTARRRLPLIAAALFGLLSLAGGALASSPPNDDFANAQLISGLPAEVTGTTIGATREQNSPRGPQEVWYRWTAPASGAVDLEIRPRSNFRVDLYTGDDLSTLEPIDLAKARDGHRLVIFGPFEAEAGRTYAIAVRSHLGSNFDLQVLPHVSGARVNARQRKDNLDLRIPVKASATVAVHVRVHGEIYVHKHGSGGRTWPLRTRGMDVDAGRTGAVAMRTKSAGVCKRILHQLSLVSVRKSGFAEARGSATFTSGSGARTQLFWHAPLADVMPEDRARIRHGEARC